jgi:eukaryotic-like serine/threonine-protein kinase
VNERADGRRIGELVGGKYRLVRLLASGGMGVVYEAQHMLVRRRFAVKFLRPHLVEQRESLARFQREAQAAGALESENLTAAVDFGIGADGSPFIVMEYLVGESLQALLAREGRLPVERATDLVAQACRGIHAAHASGIIHRDLKPQNLFVCRREDGTDLLKVLDFGIAKLELVDKGNTATRTGAVLGTPAYMSPEQARGEKNVDHGADVYALGAILYELLTGEKPHPGSSHNAILHHIATQPAVPLAPENHALPPALVEIVTRSLAIDPAERPRSAEALGQSLAPFLRRVVWPAAKVEESAPQHALPESEGAALAVPPRARGFSSRLAWAGGALLLVALVVFAVTQRGKPAEPGVRALAPEQPANTQAALQPSPPPPAAPAEPRAASAVPGGAAPALAEIPSARAEAPVRPAPTGASPTAAPRAARRTDAGAAGRSSAEPVTRVPLGSSRSVAVSFDQSNPYQ